MNLNDENKYELMDDYLGGGMTSEDIDKFRAFLQSDADLALDHQIVTEMVEFREFADSESALRNTLLDIRKEDLVEAPVSGPVSTTSGSKMRYLITAASMAAALLLLFTVFFPKDQSQNPVDSYSQFAMVEPLELTTKSVDSQLLLDNIQETYNKGDYTSALGHIKTYLVAHPNDLDIMLAMGIAKMETGDYTGAHKAFDQMSALNPRVKKYSWHKALCYLKAGDTAQAKNLLNEIVASKSYNYQQAKKLLDTFRK